MEKFSNLKTGGIVHKSPLHRETQFNDPNLHLLSIVSLSYMAGMSGKSVQDAADFVRGK